MLNHISVENHHNSKNLKIRSNKNGKNSFFSVRSFQPLNPQVPVYLRKQGRFIFNHLIYEYADGFSSDSSLQLLLVIRHHIILFTDNNVPMNQTPLCSAGIHPHTETRVPHGPTLVCGSQLSTYFWPSLTPGVASSPCFKNWIQCVAGECGHMVTGVVKVKRKVSGVWLSVVVHQCYSDAG